MTNIHQLPDADRAGHEASEWIARLQADDVTDDDRTRFEAWRTAHPLHARAFENLSATWQELRHAGRIVRAVSFGNAMSDASETNVTRARRPWVKRFGLVAAALVLCAAGLGIWRLQADAGTAFQTAVGEHASIELPDGSRLDLNSRSLARVRYRQDARIIHLMRGEAFFTVAHDPQRPFWVVAGDSWIRAVGTAFNVDLRSTGVRVVVSEGTVKVASERPANDEPSDVFLAQAPVSILTAGQQAEMRDGSAQIHTAPPLEYTRQAAWRSGSVYFDNQPLGAVIEDLSRYTSAEIVIEDPALRQLPVGGTFQANPAGVDALLRMLGDGFDLEIQRDSDRRIRIVARETH